MEKVRRNVNCKVEPKRRTEKYPLHYRLTDPNNFTFSEIFSSCGTSSYSQTFINGNNKKRIAHWSSLIHCLFSTSKSNNTPTSRPVVYSLKMGTSVSCHGVKGKQIVE